MKRIVALLILIAVPAILIFALSNSQGPKYKSITKMKSIYYNAEKETEITQKETEAKDVITITDTKCSKDGKYYYYTGTLNNDSNRTIKYIKYNIYMLNSKGKIVQSEWSNWSGTLPPGASTSIDTMIDAVSGVERYRTVIDEISYK